jgi:NAD(P)-dependent dehydrogenase (short-subunit alcohol dehydrogenase family)
MSNGNQAEPPEHGMSQVVVVSGSSGSIGGAVARRLLARGVTVIGVDSRPAEDPLSNLAYVEVRADLATSVGIASMNTALAEFPSVDHAVLCHGGASSEEVESNPLELSADVFREALEVNLVSTYLAISALVPSIRRSANRKRSLLLVSSVNALSSFGYPGYSASKSGLHGLVRCLCGPLGEIDIRINAVALGTVLDPKGSTLHGSDVGHFDRMREQAVQGKVMDPTEAAGVLCAMLDDLGPLTGEIVVADYGQSVPRFFLSDKV